MRMRFRIPGSSLLLCTVTVLACAGAYADPLHDHDNGPLTGAFGIPDSTEGSVLLDPGASAWSAMVMTASHSIDDDRNGESIILDGETTRFEFIYRRGIGRNVEVGIELPYVWHESGGLDQAVDTWHDSFGFPGGSRETRPDDLLEFLYTDETGTRIDFTTNVNGPGDARLFAGWNFRSETTHTMALRVGAKLPTGDSDDLLGSGGVDLSLGIAGDVTEWLGFERLSAYYRANAIYVGEPDLLSDRYNDVVGHLAVGLGWQATEKIDLRVQSALRTALYDSDIEVLGDESVTIVFGGNVRLTKKSVLSIAVSEDIKVDSAPDVAFQLTMRYWPD